MQSDWAACNSAICGAFRRDCGTCSCCGLVIVASCGWWRRRWQRGGGRGVGGHDDGDDDGGDDGGDPTHEHDRDAGVPGEVPWSGLVARNARNGT